MRKSTFIVMGAVAFAGLAFAACTNDYDQFQVVATAGSSAAGQGGQAGTDGGTGGASGQAGAAGQGGTAGKGGSAGTSGAGGSAGQGGANTGGTAGVGGSAGQGGTAGQGGSSCTAAQKTCDNTCVDKTDPNYGCADGTCTACAIDHATEACANNACAIGQCETGWGDCAGGVADGCEQDLNATAHCGKCNFACAQTNVMTAGCTAGKCTPTCADGWGDCTSPAQTDDGCETDLSTAANCGACGNDCSVISAAFTCKAGGNCGCSGDPSCKTGNYQGGATCNGTSGICACGPMTCKANEVCGKIGGFQGCTCMGKIGCPGFEVCCPSKNGCSPTCP